MEKLKWIACTAWKLFSHAVGLVLVMVLLYGGYVLWDFCMVYNRAAVPDEVKKFKPTVSNPSFSELPKINSDVCAWISVDDTHIDYPVLQGENNSEYLDQDLYKKYSPGGSIFLDFRSSRDFTDSYSLVYGHHMKGGAMFGDIVKFGDRQFFDRHRSGWLFLPGKTYKMELYAYLLVDAYTSPLFDVELNAGQYAERLRFIQKEAVFYRETGVTPHDRIVALSTCSSMSTNGRSIIVAKLV